MIYFQKKLQKVRRRHAYINCNFIFGSVSLIKSLWSTAKLMSTDLHSKMSPQMFKSLPFSKENIRYWSDTLVSKAMNMTKIARAQ